MLKTDNLEKLVYVSDIHYALGETVVTNEDLEKENPTWSMSQTFERTGVLSRTIASPETTALDLAEKAALAFFERTGIDRSDIDGLIFCTQTPDHLLPSNSNMLHGRLGLKEQLIAFDITHACSGFVYAIGIAKSLVVSNAATNVLVITGDTYSRLVHPQDRSVKAIFGDGASCCVVSRNAWGNLGLKDVEFWTDGSKADRFIVANGGARKAYDAELEISPDKNARVKSDNHIHMDGLGLLSFFNSRLPRDIELFLNKNKLSLEAIDLFVFHQASRLAIDGLIRALKVPESKVVRSLENTGNLVSSSIPVALAEHLAKTGANPRDTILVCGFGVGLSWSIAVLEHV